MLGKLFAARRAQVLDVDRLYRCHAGFLLRRISRFYPGDDAQEVLHEVFLKVVERGHEFRGESHERTWLYRLVTNHCIGRKRGEDRRLELWALHAPTFALDAREAEQERRLLVEQAWHQLDPEQVELAIYHYLDGYRQEDIADLLQCTRRTVVKRLARLRADLRRAIESEESDTSSQERSTRS